MIKLLVSIILMCAVSGCAFEDSQTALTAQRSLIGWSEVDLETCLGAPDQHSTFDDIDILTYIVNSTSNKGINLMGVVTLSGGGYCHATFKVKDRRVVEVHYTGETDATLAPEAYCAPIVRGCVQQSEHSEAISARSQ
jgi:hypothetical protein